MSQQIAVELGTMGFDVQARTECNRGALQRQLKQVELDAALCVEKDESGRDAVVLLLPQGPSLTSTRPDSLSAREFASRVAEQARAALLLKTLASVSPDSPGFQEGNHPEPPESPAPQLPSFEVALGGSLAGAARGLPVTIRGQGRVSWWPWRGFGITGVALFPLGAEVVEADGARARIWTNSLLAGASLRHRAASWLQFDSSLLAGGGVIVMQGDAPPPRQDSTETVLPFLIGGGFGLSGFLGERFFSRVGGMFLTYAPPLEVSFGSESVAERRFMLSLGVQMGVAFP